MLGVAHMCFEANPNCVTVFWLLRVCAQSLSHSLAHIYVYNMTMDNMCMDKVLIPSGPTARQLDYHGSSILSRSVLSSRTHNV